MAGGPTEDTHEHGGLSGGDLLQEGQDLVDDVPLVQVLQDLPQAH